MSNIPYVEQIYTESLQRGAEPVWFWRKRMKTPRRMYGTHEGAANHTSSFAKTIKVGIVVIVNHAARLESKY